MNAQLAYGLHLAGFVSGLVLLAQIEPEGRKPYARMAWSLALSGSMALFLLIVTDPRRALEDFRDAYYAAGVAVQLTPQGLSPVIERGVDGFVNLPIVAYLFWPWGLMPVMLASALFSLVGVVCVITAWWLLVRLAALDQRQAAMLMFLFAANGPLIYSFKEGNVSHMLLLLFVVALTWLRQGREFATGALLGFAAVIKPPLLLLGMYFLFRRRWRVVIGGTLMCSIAGVLSVLVFGWEMHQRWYELCIKPYSQNSIPAFNVQSIQAFVLRQQLGPDSLFDWTTHAFDPSFAILSATLLASLYGLVLLVLTGSPSRQLQSMQEVEIMIVLTLVCVSSPISWSHYYTWLLLPAAFFVSQRISAWEAPLCRYLGWLGLGVLASPVISVHWEGEWASSVYAAINVSHLLFGGLLWLGLLAWARYRAVFDQEVWN